MEQEGFVLFEQPGNEHIRVCLRLEHLRNKANYFLNKTSVWDNCSCLATIIELTNLLDRSDLRNKFAQEVGRQLYNLSRLQQTPQVDHNKLSNIIQQLENISTTLHVNNGKFADSLRQNEFIKSICRHHNTPGGICEHNTAALSLWLAQPLDTRQGQLRTWFSSFQDIFQVTNLLLHLVRTSNQAVLQKATDGFFQTHLDPQTPCQLIRVSIPLCYQVFPNISLGKHGVNIRFLEANLTDRSQQTERDIDFQFACCVF